MAWCLLSVLLLQHPFNYHVQSQFGFSARTAVEIEGSGELKMDFDNPGEINCSNEQIITRTGLCSWVTGWPKSDFCPGF
jgi:hypothetical protein